MKDDGLDVALTVTGVDNDGGERAISYFLRRLGVFVPDLMCCLGVLQLLPAPLLLLPPLAVPLLNTGEKGVAHITGGEANLARSEGSLRRRVWQVTFGGKLPR